MRGDQSRKALYLLNKEAISLGRIDKPERIRLGVINW